MRAFSVTTPDGMSDPRQKSVDVAINAYGKPYQTAVTLFTLLKHSGEWIDKIYFIEESRQPHQANFRPLLQLLGNRVIYYKPHLWLWTNNLKFRFLLKFKWFRYAIRYQYAGEKTDKKYLLVMHNDIYFKGDLVGEYLAHIGSAAGIGRIGQCWGCPAYTAGHCDPERYTSYKPGYDEIMRLARDFPHPRTHTYMQVVDPETPWPLPECRLNEYVAMVDLEQTRKETIPYGKGSAFGSYDRLDIGVKWFSDMCNLGYSFTHFDYDPFATHSWVSLQNAGHKALFDDELYHYEEKVAKETLEREFGISISLRARQGPSSLYYSSLIQMLRKPVRSPWSWSRIGPRP